MNTRPPEYEAQFLDSVKEALIKIPLTDRAKIAANTDMMRAGKFDSVFIKPIRGSIKELRVKQYRMLFFTQKHTLYFVRIFIKKTQKTPVKEIEAAQKIYDLMISN